VGSRYHEILLVTFSAILCWRSEHHTAPDLSVSLVGQYIHEWIRLIFGSNAVNPVRSGVESTTIFIDGVDAATDAVSGFQDFDAKVG
jgi:hypothetical protein